MKHIDFYIHSVDSIIEVLEHEYRPTLLIQIAEDERIIPPIYYDNIVAKPMIICDDVERVGIKGTKPFNPAHAKKIVHFWKKHQHEIEAVYCHCVAGISRSSATCASLMYDYYGFDSDIWNDSHYDPNLLIYKLMLKELGHSDYKNLVGIKILQRKAHNA